MGVVAGGVAVARQDVYNAFRDLGLPHNQAANFAGVLSNEGGYRGGLYTGSFGGQASENGGVLNPNGAYGIAQWNGDRQAGLQAYATANGLQPTDLQAQTGFALQEAQSRGINLDSVGDIVNRFETPAQSRRATEIDNSTATANQFDPDSYTGSGGSGASASTSTAPNPNGTDSLDQALGDSGGPTGSLSLDGATLNSGVDASSVVGAPNAMAGLPGLGGLLGGLGSMLGLPPAVTGAITSALGLTGATGSIQSLTNAATGSSATGGGNISGFAPDGPVQASPGLVTATNQVAQNTATGDRQIQQGVQTAGQTIGQAITTQSQSWISWFGDTTLRIMVLVIGIALFIGALYYFGKPQIDEAVSNVASKVPNIKGVPIPV